MTQMIQLGIEQLATGLSEHKADFRELRNKQETDARELRREMDELRDRLEDKINALSVKLESSLRKMTIGWFLSVGGILGVLAKGFHWI